MTIGFQKVDGDSHTSVRYFIGMTRSDDASNSYLLENSVSILFVLDGFPVALKYGNLYEDGRETRPIRMDDGRPPPASQKPP